MGFVSRILLGLFIAALGSVLVIKTHMVIDLFGSSEWAERKLGGGGTNLLYKAVGLLFIFVGFLVATNLWNTFLGATLGSIIPHGA